jgi:hypothetical protein
VLHAAERRSEDSQTGSEDSLVQLRRNVVIYVKNVMCIAYFVIFINCVSVIPSIVVRYLFNNKQIKKKQLHICIDTYKVNIFGQLLYQIRIRIVPVHNVYNVVNVSLPFCNMKYQPIYS